MPADDLEVLPAALRASARRLSRSPSGAVAWLLPDAVSVINALADAGRLILGTDLREYAEHDRYFEVAWSAYEGGDVEGGRQAALAALRREDRPGHWWSSPGGRPHKHQHHSRSPPVRRSGRRS